MTIQEKNEKVAKFMGFLPTSITGVYGTITENGELVGNLPVGVPFCEIEDLYFDKSWDWLMPVVEKIESMGSIVDIWLSLGKGCRI